MESNKTYKEELEELQKKFNSDKLNLARKHAELNNPYKVGDIIKSKWTNVIIKITGWNTYVDLFPYLVFKGTKLKKNLEPFKDGSIDSIYNHTHTIKLN